MGLNEYRALARAEVRASVEAWVKAAVDLASALDSQDRIGGVSIRTPKPRRITASVIWPGDPHRPDTVIIKGKGAKMDTLVLVLTDLICQDCSWTPSHIVAALRRVDWATNWCRDRLAGLERYARHLLDQQARQVAELEARAALRKLAKGQ